MPLKVAKPFNLAAKVFYALLNQRVAGKPFLLIVVHMRTSFYQKATYYRIGGVE